VAVAEAERLGGADGAATPPAAGAGVVAGEEPVPAGGRAPAQGEVPHETRAEGDVQTVTDPGARADEARPGDERGDERGTDGP
jgi:hypothetical protein